MLRFFLVLLGLAVLIVTLPAAFFAWVFVLSPVFSGHAPNAPHQADVAGIAVLSVGLFVAIFCFWLAQRLT